MVPADCRYTKTHEWVKMENGIVTVGITDHAQDALGDITFVELPASGATLEQGKPCGVIESVKAASDLYSPVSGTVCESNASLSSSPEIINAEPHGGGWLFKAQNVAESQFLALMDVAAYETFLESEQ